MISNRVFYLPRAILMIGLAFWMLIAVFNNITDSSTNLVHLKAMLSMKGLIDDPVFGNGLEWRAWGNENIRLVLYLVIGWQFATAAMLAVAAIRYLKVLIFSYQYSSSDQLFANLALSMFLALWLFFLCGGLWFGYWMKQGAIQNVHMTLTTISLASLIYINQAVPTDSKSFKPASIHR